MYLASFLSFPIFPAETRDVSDYDVIVYTNNQSNLHRRGRLLKSKKNGKKAKKQKTAGKKNNDNIQEGFEAGMTKEIAGSWVGDEKFKYEGAVLNYCSHAIFNPTNDKNYLTWNAAYLDDTDGSCKGIGLDPLNGTINAGWYPMVDPNEAYILKIEQKKCLEIPECNYDIFSSGDFAGFKLISKACGAHLKKDKINNNSFSCELYQTNLLKNAENVMKLVVILTYTSYQDGYDNYVCPLKPTYSKDDFIADSNAEGMAQFVLQAGFDNSWQNTTAWDCTSS